MRRRTAVAAVLAVGVTVGPGLTACGSSQSSAGGKPTLTWYINPDGGGSDPTKKGQAQIAKECTDAAGGRYAIRVQLLPNSASDQRQQLLRRLAAKDSGIDLMSIDPVFVAEFAEAKFLAPVPQDDGGRLHQGHGQRRGAGRHVEGEAGRRAVLGQHPAALVPQERGQGGRAGHDPARDLGAADQGGAVAEEDDRRPGQPLRGLRRLDQRPDRRCGRQDPAQNPGATADQVQAGPGDARPARRPPR